MREFMYIHIVVLFVSLFVCDDCFTTYTKI